MRLSQIQERDGKRQVIAFDDGSYRPVKGVTSVRALADEAIRQGEGLVQAVKRQGLGSNVDIAEALAERRVLPPIDHPDSAHLIITGTGLTHLGSAAARDAMHKPVKEETLSDSMKMFRMGLEGGKPQPGASGVQPEWFYKGDGSLLSRPGAPLLSPSFAEDGGEEPEIAGIYLIAGDGVPFRLGFALGNEFSDHIMERRNYLFLAHSKLRPSAIGPELLVGELPQDVRGTSRIRRSGKVIWEKPFLSGEANMSHAIANLEAHHFKYDVFRKPGDIHVHLFGTATLSFADGVRTQAGDVFEIEAAEFGLPLANPLATALPVSVTVRSL